MARQIVQKPIEIDPLGGRGEIFTWTIDRKTRQVVARRPKGQILRSATDKHGLAIHCREHEKIVDIALHSKNAFDFLMRVDRI